MLRPRALRRNLKTAAVYAAIAGMLVTSGPVQAATYTWNNAANAATGSVSPANNMWSNTANWLNSVAPDGTDTSGILQFNGGGYTANNDLSAGFNLNQIQIVNTFSSAYGTAAALNLTGNALDFSAAGVISQNGFGAVNISNDLGLTGGLTIDGTGGVLATAGGILTGVPTMSLGGVISGSGPLTLSTFGGTTVVSGANTFTGGVNMNSGTLSVAADANLGDASNGVTFGAPGSGVLLASNSFTSARAVTFAGNGAIDAASGKTLALTGALAGTGSMFIGKTAGDTGIVNLQGISANTTAGNVYLNGGTLSISSDAQLGAGTNNLVFGGGTLQAATTNPFTTARNITLATGGTIDVVNGQTLTATGLVSGSGSLTVTDSGTLGIDGVVPNTYTGTTTLSAGSNLTVNSAGGLGSGPLTMASGTTLDLEADQSIAAFAGTNAGALTLDANLTVNQSTKSTMSGVISGIGSLTMNGTGNLTLSGANLFTGGTTINSGVVTFGSIAATGGTSNGAIAVNSGGVAAASFAMTQAFLDNVTSGGAAGGVIALGASSSAALSFAADNLAGASLGATGAFTYSGALTPN
ncbi:MAG TPA: autotransporter-associated beta strand repeat-containing protein, partial [Pirellulales bacterium]